MTRNEELEQMEQQAREQRTKSRKKGSTLRKTLKRAAINDVGFVAVSVRGMTQIFDTSFKGLLFIAEIDKTMLDFADSFAAEFMKAAGIKYSRVWIMAVDWWQWQLRHGSCTANSRPMHLWKQGRSF